MKAANPECASIGKMAQRQYIYKDTLEGAPAVLYLYERTPANEYTALEQDDPYGYGPLSSNSTSAIITNFVQEFGQNVNFL